MWRPEKFIGALFYYSVYSFEVRSLPETKTDFFSPVDWKPTRSLGAGITGVGEL